jgi:hypothetical protein
MSKRVFIVAACLAVAACGGGGGGGDASAVASTPEATAEITSENAAAIAGATADAALFSSEFDDLANLGIVASPGGVAVVQSAAGASITLAKDTSRLQATTIGPQTESCPFGGTMTISATIENPETLTAGDMFTMNYDNCDFGEGSVADGGIVFTVTSFQGDLVGTDFAMGFDLELTGFSMVGGGESVNMDGDFSLLIDTDATSSTVTVSGNSLTLTDGTDSFVLSAFSTTTTVDTSTFPASFTVASSGFLMSSEFDGEVEFSTTIAMQGSGEGNPFSGEFVVSGANGATVTVIPLDGDMVRLELDLDGDGAVDQDGTVDMTWQQLLGASAQA